MVTYTFNNGNNVLWYSDQFSLHRDNGLPAMETPVRKEWWVNGLKHRDNDLPAVESLKCKEWWVNGKRHRDNGLPAIEYTNGIKKWYVNGQLLKISIETKNTQIMYFQGAIHNTNGPAIVSPTCKAWYVNGLKHRGNSDSDSSNHLPAIEKYSKSGTRTEWWVNGKRHRENGPALLWIKDGIIVREEWWLNGLKHRDNNERAIMWIKDDNIIREEWWLNGKRHRTNGYAKRYKSNTYWLIDGNVHREDGPAIERCNDQSKEWCLYNNCVRKQDFDTLLEHIKPFMNNKGLQHISSLIVQYVSYSKYDYEWFDFAEKRRHF